MRHERKAPSVGRKVNTVINENIDRLEAAINAQKEREKDRFPLRIDERTVIMVSRSNHNKKYAEEYKLRMVDSSKAAVYNYIPDKK